MSSVGMVGCGKLGLPVALAIEGRGHEVHGYDVSLAPATYLSARRLPYQEAGIDPYLDSTKMTIHSSVGELVANSEIIFLAIQTPHDAEYEGVTPLPDTRRDFDYTYLKDAVRSVAEACRNQRVARTVVTISTCLPGTFNREIEPLLSDNIRYAYGPQFIAMGTVVADYLNPEFNLIGVHDEEAAKQLQDFYATINDAPSVVTDITTAEAIKVSYNTWITAKTVIANLWGEIAHKTGANFDDIQKAWALSTKRIFSDKYTKSGVGDGGGCHPRDNIALSHIARELDLSYDFFESLMLARQEHMRWLAKEAAALAAERQLPLVILGKSFKPETNIETGSAARLMANLAAADGQSVLNVEDIGAKRPCVFVLGTAHVRYKDYKFPPGSVVIDPFRILGQQDGVELISIGGGYDSGRRLG